MSSQTTSTISKEQLIEMRDKCMERIKVLSDEWTSEYGDIPFPEPSWENVSCLKPVWQRAGTQGNRGVDMYVLCLLEDRFNGLIDSDHYDASAAETLLIIASLYVA